MADYKLYGRITINDGSSVISREVSQIKSYPEMTYSDLVIPANDIVNVPFGTVAVCKFVAMKTDKTCTVTLTSGSDSVDLIIDDILILVDTELDSISIASGNSVTNVSVLVAGE